jgi:hypothetical protein
MWSVKFAPNTGFATIAARSSAGVGWAERVNTKVLIAAG